MTALSATNKLLHNICSQNIKRSYLVCQPIYFQHLDRWRNVKVWRVIFVYQIYYLITFGRCLDQKVVSSVLFGPFFANKAPQNDPTTKKMVSNEMLRCFSMILTKKVFSLMINKASRALETKLVCWQKPFLFVNEKYLPIFSQSICF